VCRSGATTVRRVASGTSELTVRVQRAAEGERFYTWRGRVRQLFPEDGRLVLNAYLGEELVGSAIVSAHEADEDEQRETAWTLADAQFSPAGPYFGDPDLFPEPCYLHFESLYTRRDLRQRGVAAALIEAIWAIGLPTFAEFRPKWLPDVFERWRVTEENQDEALFWTQEGAGGSLGVALSLALDGEVLEAAPFEASNFRISFQAQAGGERIVARDADYRAPNDDEAGNGEDDDVSLHEEGLIEADRVHVAPQPWDEDDARWLPKELEEELSFHLREDRSGVALSGVEIEVLAAPSEGSRVPVRYRVTVVGRVEDPPLLLARARWRRYLRTFEEDWMPAEVGEALSEVARLSRFALTQWPAE
jgi:GNAT superfamily N-acetyltransferase